MQWTWDDQGQRQKKMRKMQDLYYLEAPQSKAGAESHRLYDSSREVVSVWKYKYVPEMIGKKKKPKNPHKTKAPSLKHMLSNPGPKSWNRPRDSLSDFWRLSSPAPLLQAWSARLPQRSPICSNHCTSIRWRKNSTTGFAFFPKQYKV